MILLVIEYATPDMLTDILFPEFKMLYRIGDRIGVRLSGGCRTWIDYVYLVVGRCRRRGFVECSINSNFRYLRKTPRRNR